MLFREHSEKKQPQTNDLSTFFVWFLIIKNFVNIGKRMDFLKPR